MTKYHIGLVGHIGAGDCSGKLLSLLISSHLRVFILLLTSERERSERGENAGALEQRRRPMYAFIY